MTDEHARAPGSEALTVDGLAVAAPLTLGQAQTLARDRLLADDPPGLQVVWHRLVSQWGSEVASARQDPGEPRLGERVNGEWSLVETLRHLVFVTDAWIGQGICDSQERHPLGLPPHFVTNGRELGLDLDARPGLDEVLEARRSRQAIVDQALSSADELGSPCAGRLAGFSRRGAFQVVMAEEWFHLGFARRDLSALRSGSLR